MDPQPARAPRRWSRARISFWSAAQILVWMLLCSSCRRDAEAWRSAATEREAVARLLGEALSKEMPGASAVIVGNPFLTEPGARREAAESEAAALRGLRAGFGASIRIEAVVPPELRAGARQNPESLVWDRETTTPLSFLMTEDAFERIAASHPHCGLIVSLVGVPFGRPASPLQSGGSKPRPRWGLLLPDLRLAGGWDAVLKDFSSGQIAAAVVERTGASRRGGLERYEVLTRTNAAAFAP